MTVNSKQHAHTFERGLKQESPPTECSRSKGTPNVEEAVLITNTTLKEISLSWRQEKWERKCGRICLENLSEYPHLWNSNEVNLLQAS